ncbi:hypothetical protein J2TS4_09320 [Paenibacillus sp. J2TS4]|nr:hypothetical protein J2TS4_09320 [Paenibacillus sp. J2TS4]
MNESDGLFELLYPDLIPFDVARKVLECYGIIMAVNYKHTMSIKIINSHVQLSYVQLGIFVSAQLF